MEKDKDKVSCDNKDCEALLHPETLEEYKIALEHCKNHSSWGGCSHGC